MLYDIFLTIWFFQSLSVTNNCHVSLMSAIFATIIHLT